jgi:methyl coenzyme M reductase alpha subunit
MQCLMRSKQGTLIRYGAGGQVVAMATKLDDLLRELLPGVTARSSEELSSLGADSLATTCVRVGGLLSDPEVTASITNTLNARYDQVWLGKGWGMAVGVSRTLAFGGCV